MAYIETRTTSDGDTRYRALVRMKGHPSQSATFRLKSQAVRWVQDTESAIREGRYFKTAEAKKHTLEELIDYYFEQVLPEKRTGQKKTASMLRWWRKKLGHLTLDKVTRKVIIQMRGKLRRGTTYRGGRRSVSTCNRYLQALSHCLSVARDDLEWIERNPCRKVKFPEPEGRVRYLGQNDDKDDDRAGELERLLTACRESRDRRLLPLVVLAISTGARAGELLRLRWPDVDFEREVANLEETKNRDRRAIAITGLAAKLLRKLKMIRRLDTNLVFAHPRTGKAKFPQKPWEEALADAQIDDFRFHDLRHSCASFLAMQGASLPEIGAVLGHRSPSVTKRYAHLSETHTLTKVAEMNRSVFSEVE